MIPRHVGGRGEHHIGVLYCVGHMPIAAPFVWLERAFAIPPFKSPMMRNCGRSGLLQKGLGGNLHALSAHAVSETALSGGL